MSRSNVFLIGPMGAGKSTIGRQLARRLDLPFRDCDRELEQRAGVDIATIFEYEGEAGFRRREARMLAELVEERGIVLATGGGAVLLEENRERLAANGVVVYLDISVEEQLRRTRHDRVRPLLRTDTPRERLEQLAAQRNPLYTALANLRVNTGGRGWRSVVNQILEALPQLQGET